ncbi:helix-turn-helix transcriptional regulator [Umezawaea endophytica]|uniref:Helix-turn-helix transcriptional regulator n=1 Tax=Umezawaea endophytica TaxID=1654476 RepID=A0A9X2VPH0_9PSEU|nr:helix-turn-helix transcriptional regulator [Umezawaea endophytica]MCS7480275.1 helix-turn-helix transcriptional regulator [Umezawaea endophytica]
MRANNHLGEFLRARRTQLTPRSVGLPVDGRRRVPGLRREEVADLAGLSTDYYTRLEQGRERHPSRSVLDALARALLFDEEALRYLRSVADHSPRRRRKHAERPRVDPELLALLELWTSTPAIVLDSLTNVVGANQLGRAVYEGHEHGDCLARMVFLDEDARSFYGDWTSVAHATVASLRAAGGADPDDPGLIALVGELSLRSDEFRTMWGQARVHVKTRGSTLLRHPLVGDLHLNYESLTVNAAPGLTIKVFHPVPDTRTADALALLGSLTAGRSTAHAPERAPVE